MPLLLADFIYTRDCKLNLRKNVDTTCLTGVIFGINTSLEDKYRILKTIKEAGYDLKGFDIRDAIYDETARKIEIIKRLPISLTI